MRQRNNNNDRLQLVFHHCVASPSHIDLNVVFKVEKAAEREIVAQSRMAWIFSSHLRHCWQGPSNSVWVLAKQLPAVWHWERAATHWWYLPMLVTKTMLRAWCSAMFVCMSYYQAQATLYGYEPTASISRRIRQIHWVADWQQLAFFISGKNETAAG